MVKIKVSPGKFFLSPCNGFHQSVQIIACASAGFHLLMHNSDARCTKRNRFVDVDSRSLANVRPAGWDTHHICLSLCTHIGGIPAREFGMMITNLVLIYGGGDGSGDGVRKEYEGCCQSWSWDSSCHFTSTCHSENMANGMKNFKVILWEFSPVSFREVPCLF